MFKIFYQKYGNINIRKPISLLFIDLILWYKIFYVNFIKIILHSCTCIYINQIIYLKNHQIRYWKLITQNQIKCKTFEKIFNDVC